MQTGAVASVVFLRGINVGGASLCKPAALAKQLKKFDIVNIGAAGTFVVRETVSESVLRQKIAVQLAKTFGIKCEIMIVPAKAVLDLAKRDPFAKQPAGPDITRFVSVLAKPLNSSHATRHSSLSLPSDKDWLLRIIAIRNRFVLGFYRRQMKAISYLGKIEKILGVPGTVRNWNTIEKVLKVLQSEQ